jgi:probable rRNA maturation factor
VSAFEVEVLRDSADAAPDDAAFDRWVAAALSERREGAVVSLRIVDADEGRALNAQWRGRDAPTNVLSFPADLPDEVGLPLLGDLVLCAPVVQREAAEQGKAEEDHWAHLVVHGVLHLLGMDHQADAEAEAMEALEREILASLGIADPYAAELRGGAVDDDG